jgi:hypothetical protein
VSKYIYLQHEVFVFAYTFRVLGVTACALKKSVSFGDFVWQPVSKLPLGYTQEPARFNYYREMNDGALINMAATAAILVLLLETLMCSKFRL